VAYDLFLHVLGLSHRYIPRNDHTRTQLPIALYRSGHIKSRLMLVSAKHKLQVNHSAIKLPQGLIEKHHTVT